jgi:hypothetical protein
MANLTFGSIAFSLMAISCRRAMMLDFVGGGEMSAWAWIGA